MQKKRSWQLFCMGLLTLGLETAAFGISLLLDRFFHAPTLIPVVFVLAVFLAAFFTSGYLFGIAASLMSVLAVNFAFSFPYFSFDFTLPENLLSAGIMITVTVLTSTLTAQLKRQEQLGAEADREKMRANLLRSISHDLRTPLTSIYGSSSAILENYDSLSRAQHIKLLGDIRDEAQWLTQVFENLLSVTKINAGGDVQLNKPPVVLEELVDGVVARFHKRYPSKPVLVQIPDEFIRIPMDAMLMEQVIFNLLENAVLHATGMTQIRFSVQIVGSNAQFEIADDGCGIPAEKMASLFTGCARTSQDDDRETRRGMGIGLSVCDTIVRAHGGIIKAENTPGGGACFGFTLPIEEN